MAASTGKLDVEVEVRTLADRFWKTIRDCPTVFPMAPDSPYKNEIQELKGDGKSVGSVRLVKFNEGSLISISEEKIDAVDEAKKTVTCSVVGGDLLKYYKNFKSTLVVSPKKDGSLVKWTCEFDKASEETPPDLNIIRDFAVKNFQDLDDYNAFYFSEGD